MFCYFLVSISCDNYAILYCGSNGWINYRHQANIGGMYKRLLDNNFKKENIFIASYNDIPFYVHNPYYGKLYNDQSHDYNVYPGDENIQYKGSDVTAETFYRMLLNIPSTQNDNVFVYYCDHGEVGYLSVPDNNGMPILADDLNNALNTMYKLRKYKNLMFAIEACHSGSVAKKITAPNSIVMVAAKEEETSKSGDHDDTISLPVNDLFSKYLLLSLKENPHYTIYETFNFVKSAITKHTVELYCDDIMKNMLVSDFVGTPKNQKALPLEHKSSNVSL